MRAKSKKRRGIMSEYPQVEILIETDPAIPDNASVDSPPLAGRWNGPLALPGSLPGEPSVDRVFETFVDGGGI
jgi:hypothetical protein